MAIDSRLGPYFEDVLVHEIAHAVVAAIESQEAEEHSDLWGSVYARVYRSYFDLDYVLAIADKP